VLQPEARPDGGNHPVPDGKQIRITVPGIVRDTETRLSQSQRGVDSVQIADLFSCITQAFDGCTNRRTPGGNFLRMLILLHPGKGRRHTTQRIAQFIGSAKVDF
jgi:hypothetical protein